MQLQSTSTLGIFGSEGHFEILIGDEVGGGGGHVAKQSGAGAAEDGADAALAVQLAHDVQWAGVVLAAAHHRAAHLIGLNLQQTFDALAGRHNRCCEHT